MSLHPRNPTDLADVVKGIAENEARKVGMDQHRPPAPAETKDPAMQKIEEFEKRLLELERRVADIERKTAA